MSIETLEYGIKFCPGCGNPVKISKQTTNYNIETGKIEGYSLELKCTNSFFKCSWRRMGTRWLGYRGVLVQ